MHLAPPPPLQELSLICPSLFCTYNWWNIEAMQLRRRQREVHLSRIGIHTWHLSCSECMHFAQSSHSAFLFIRDSTGAEGSIGPESNAWFHRFSHPLTWRKEFGWELKNRSHVSKLLLAQVTRNEFIFDSCSPGPRVTLIQDSCFWALIQALSVKQRKRVQEPKESRVALRSYSRDWRRVRAKRG